ncbi:hypothetical protein [Burkholderia thailandensis]|uniref:hypothetical protein n=1 Tax=Burkholderia thailandensis TaxID=57975 RepID=UPI0039C87199
MRRFGGGAPVGVTLRVPRIRRLRFCESAQQIRLFAGRLRPAHRRTRGARAGVAPRLFEAIEPARLRARRVSFGVSFGVPFGVSAGGPGGAGDGRAGGRPARHRRRSRGGAEKNERGARAKRAARGGDAAGAGRRARLHAAARRRGARPPLGRERTGRTGT